MSSFKSGNLVRTSFHVINVEEIQWIDFDEDNQALINFRGDKEPLEISPIEFDELCEALELKESKSTKKNRKTAEQALVDNVKKMKRRKPAK